MAKPVDRKNHKDYQEQLRKAKEKGRRGKDLPKRWRARYRRPDGSQTSQDFHRQQEAQDFLDDLAVNKKKGIFYDPQDAKTLIEEGAEEWLNSQLHLEESTRVLYRGALDNHILPKWGKTQYGAVTHADGSAWYQAIYNPDLNQQDPEDDDDEDPVPIKTTGVGASYLHTIHRVFHQILDWGVMGMKIPFNPAARISLPRKPPSKHIYLNHQQIDLLANEVANYPYRKKAARAMADAWRVLILVLAYTGLRWGEATAIRVGRVDLDRRRIYIEEAVKQGNGKPYFGLPKTHEQRAVSIPRFLVREIETLTAGKSARDLLFTSAEGGILRAPNFRNRVFLPIVRKLAAEGLIPKGMTPHKLRHTAASIAIAARADVKVVQNMLGHKTASMTLDRYGHLFPDRLDEVADAMEEHRQHELAKAA
ncbi:tyrosine-type recombinase/integrase [Salininema proteolyticum]|uniref:Tyrosine-type recombinase/integrase n=1 Tax=Salininema proteolyticum TaxID=1607685 RepID=A0ABV8TZ30_9ACTN